MKIVLLCVGLNRSLSWTHESIVSELVRPLFAWKGHEVEVISLFIKSNAPLDNPRTGEKGTTDSFLPSFMLEGTLVEVDQEELSDQTSSLARELTNFGDTWGDGGKSIRNALIYLAALERASALLPDSSDIVISYRPDVAISRSLHIKAHVRMVSLLTNFGLSVARIPRWGGWRKRNGINDRFAVLSGRAIDQYLRRIALLPAAFGPTESFYSGALVSKALTNCLIQKSISTEMVRIRVGGAPEQRDVSRSETPRGLTWSASKKLRKGVRKLRNFFAIS